MMKSIFYFLGICAVLFFSTAFQTVNQSPANTPDDRYIKINVGANGAGDYSSEIFDSNGSKINIKIVVENFCESKI